MCAVCVAQGVTYVGGALAGLQVMAARAKARRLGSEPVETPDGEPAAEREPEREPAPELTRR